MTQEEKQLLLKDLSARLPYEVIVIVNGNNEKVDEINPFEGIITCGFQSFDVKECKPYLRPMSSMTEEELKELKTLCSIYIPTDSPTIGFEDYGILIFTHHLANNTYSFKLNIDSIDWLNAHYFDYRGLIEKGLAIEAPKGMYRVKNNLNGL